MDLNNNSSSDTSFQFKPITKGLGFNKKSDFEEINIPKTPKVAVNDSRRAIARSIQKNLQQDIRKSQTIASRPTPLGVSGSQNIAVTAPKIKTDPTVESALSLFHKFFSWLVDTSLIFVTAIFSTLSIEYFVTNAWNWNVVSLLENWVYITGPLFSFYFIFYYSIFWKTTQRTLGMALFGLEISSKENSEIHLKQTFLRSLLSFASLFTFGILDILGLTDALSWTRVSKAS